MPPGGLIFPSKAAIGEADPFHQLLMGGQRVPLARLPGIKRHDLSLAVDIQHVQVGGAREFRADRNWSPRRNGRTFGLATLTSWDSG